MPSRPSLRDAGRFVIHKMTGAAAGADYCLGDGTGGGVGAAFEGFVSRLPRVVGAAGAVVPDDLGCQRFHSAAFSGRPVAS